MRTPSPSPSPRMVLLNSEGAILTAYRQTWAGHTRYQIWDQWKVVVAVWTGSEVEEWLHGSSTLVDSRGREWIYTHHSGSMKPDLRALDEFIGRDTTGLTY